MNEHEGRAPRSRDERQILGMVRWLLILAFVVIGYVVLAHIGPILTPLVVAAGVAYLLDGWVDALVARRVPRVAAVAMLLVAFLSIVAGLLLVAAPLIVGELAHFIAALPGLLDTASSWAGAKLGLELPASWRDYASDPRVEQLLESYAGPAAAFTAAAVGGALGFVGFLAELLIIPVFAFYFLVDWDHIVVRARGLVPMRHRSEVYSIAAEIDGAVSTWIRGQLIVISLLAVLYAIAFRVIGVPMGITVGVAVGLLTIIPFLGTFVGAALTVGLMLLDWQGQGPGPMMAVGGVFVALHLLEAAVLTPKLVGKKVGLGEVGALFAVIAGGELLGFVGVLLAVPIAASVAVLVRRALAYYQRSAYFGDEDGPDGTGEGP